MWSLVIVWIVSGTPYVEIISRHETMYECFFAFEYYDDKIRNTIGNQLVCINGEIK